MKFLDKIYDDPGAIDARETYSQWAETYDQEVTEAGYLTPGRCAEVLAAHAPDKAAPVLDLGCGTGLSGLALRQAGFLTIDGWDVSDEMLARARARDPLYRQLVRIEPDAPLAFAPGDYAHVLAAGVITPDHAPPETVGAILDRLAPGGVLVFSLNDHALEHAAFPAAAAQAVDAGLADKLHEEHGEHLPTIGLGATVYALRRR